MADLVELTKPRITLMVVVTAGIGLLLASGGQVPMELVLHTLIGTGLVAAGSAALNHVLERDIDALMRRTADRPLPAGRMSPDLALTIGVGLAVVGLVELALGVNLTTALLGAAALAGYVFVYTPLKKISPLATVVGAVPGAIPPMMGWAAVTESLEPGAWVLFAILFLWQLPHFLAIAWMCREDYARAGLPMLPVIQPDGRSTARQMVLYGAALLPVSLLPSMLGLTGSTYFLGAMGLGLFFLAVCIAFAVSLSALAARRVLLTSVLYLPAVLVVMVLDRVA
ncbi:MAG: protoheme IX farnesyltransferase [Acidobacteria bacterium]|nr:MAG: protoheme IX farnesyltransferase [Acidobacteriota bacterium]